MTNPFFEKSTLPYQLPPFADIADEHYEEAFEKGMEDQLSEISAITRKRDFPMFENTFPALESSGQLLWRVAHVFFNKSAAEGFDNGTDSGAMREFSSDTGIRFRDP